MQNSNKMLKLIRVHKTITNYYRFYSSLETKEKIRKPRRPKSPDYDKCCAKDCKNCFLDGYVEKMQDYEKKLEAWQSSNPVEKNTKRRGKKISITVRMISGEEISVEVCNNYTVTDLAKEIQGKSKMDANSMRFVNNGNILTDETKTLNSQGIKSGSMILLFSKPGKENNV